MADTASSMAEFRRWTVHFDDGNNVVDGKRVQDPPGFAAGGGKELVRVTQRERSTNVTITDIYHTALLLRSQQEETANT